MVKTKSSRVDAMNDIIFFPEYAYSIEEIDFDDSSGFLELWDWDWDEVSRFKVVQYNSIGKQTFWLESLKNWDYEKNQKWLNERVEKTIKWLKENHPELML